MLVNFNRNDSKNININIKLVSLTLVKEFEYRIGIKCTNDHIWRFQTDKNKKYTQWRKYLQDLHGKIETIVCLEIRGFNILLTMKIYRLNFLFSMIKRACTIPRQHSG